MTGGAQAFMAQALDRTRWARFADSVAVALAASLPWSTSATGILAVLLVLALIPTLDVAALRRVLLTPAGGLPVLLWALGVAGMLWTDVPMSERLDGLGSFHKLLFIPLLMVQFERSDHGRWVFAGFMASCTVLLAVSWGLMLTPGLSWRGTYWHGVPVKNYATQGDVFTFCTFAASAWALLEWRQGRQRRALALAVLALAFFVNVLYIATSRTALVVIPVLLLPFCWRWIGWKGTAGLVVALAVLGGIAWSTSGLLRERIDTFATELSKYRDANAVTSAGTRMEFWIKSVRIIEAAPVIGHGTGSIRDQFRRVATGDTGASSLVAANPHNQTFAVAIQLGLLGTVALYALWLWHLLLFRVAGLAAWLGLTEVLQNIVGSLFNSHLFDFTQGWMYVVGVGVAGGSVLWNARRAGIESAMARPSVKS